MSIKIQFGYSGQIDIKAKKIIYQNDSCSNNIEIEVFVFKIAEKWNLMAKLEKYRELVRDSKGEEARILFEDNKEDLYRTINQFSNPFSDFNFDSIIAFYPEDVNRRELLDFFVKKIAKNSESRDKSNCFEKKDKQKSVVDGLSKEDFILCTENLNEMRNLLLVDDVIDRGRTINIFLDKLIENGIDITNINIKLVCIYHNLRLCGIKETCP